MIKVVGTTPSGSSIPWKVSGTLKLSINDQCKFIEHTLHPTWYAIPVQFLLDSFQFICSSTISHIAYFSPQFQLIWIRLGECTPLGLYLHNDHPVFKLLSMSVATYAQVGPLFPLSGIFALTWHYSNDILIAFYYYKDYHMHVDQDDTTGIQWAWCNLASRQHASALIITSAKQWRMIPAVCIVRSRFWRGERVLSLERSTWVNLVRVWQFQHDMIDL